MKLALLLLIIGGWFYLRRKFKKKDGPSFPWVDWFLGIMISLYSLIVAVSYTHLTLPTKA